ncbi:Salicylate biosynthesis protein PchB [Tritonibacter multivorans]|uniref:chorismate mutase n=1 Tax=Tritonibacter multivorans TaxID=928856 RepID=A0A0P1G1N7_9RHOB|nr:chorismate mutase [Tritonibacter multivorans]MDA7419486.1 chorismate mutase [Tritonibacter multivorans]CUH75559.1 Salicylate biosynthesis protein PchB [Tritonibacter multivorans]SFC65291.1 isochorismate pyruvate lyase [Tritonibacter multivorans]
MTNRIPPKDCNDMTDLRAQIDALDEDLVALFVERAGYIDRAIALKQINGWPARIPERVEEVVTNAGDRAEAAGLDRELVERLWRQLVDWSIAREAQVIREE